MTLKNFDQLLKKYANLIVNKGIGVNKDDYILIFADLDQAPLVRLVTEAAYQAGAKFVKVNWADDALTRLHFTHQTEETLTDIPQYKIDEGNYYVEKRAKRISLRSSDPNVLKGIDPAKINAANRASSHAMKDVRIATQSNLVSWLVVAGAGKEWAALVFPDLETSQEQVDALWDQIFKTTRIYEDDPIKAWDEHEDRLSEKARFLNEQQFDQLHYTGPGTDFTVGLPKNHVWESAGSLNEKGEVFIANMPTEEVFTAPDARRAEGYISSSKPLAYGGTVIDGMKFTFKDGKVTEVNAKEGEETLRQLVKENDGSDALGEVALVAHKSPISQSGIIFYNTLFDENASNHIALGQAYATSVKNGAKMSQEELEEVGLNRSNVHVDFMVGNAEMNIDGIAADGTVTPIFRKGEWAF
ncbi:aminopeptidase [Facklamia miroungae]|uniref:Aminopeptidase n=1 Tax=Facklamia miroungae TaxID=120956 RepID=A0A1G7TI06_9LACT|nr:aminopeptidase [Facklamia miroungae]NKZ29826.1 aminopeptidase [Facklamia miroungae]SDG34987.1 aminopeptidase [Facklamia miroungae]